MKSIKTSNKKVDVVSNQLFKAVAKLLIQSKRRIALSVNTELTLLNWNIGRLIFLKVLEEEKAAYGEQIVATLSQLLMKEFGKGFTLSALSRLQNFYKLFPHHKIVATLSQQLSWSHFVVLVAIKNDLQREFYTQLSIKERWSVRTLRERIDSMLYERTALSKKPNKLIKPELKRLKSEGLSSPDLVFRDPYILDFLALKDTYSEYDFETAILRELQLFIIELGSDFAFIARQKRIIIDNEDHKIDLLFYHRTLRRLVAIDLKLGKFKAAYKGQMELYLKWLEKHERKRDEETPIGLILCAEKQQEQIELLELNKGNIKVAEYFTQLPSKKLLAKKLHLAINIANNQSKDAGKKA
ncbi:MAG: PDDEXK nuclease domain-containing protein [Bacteroidota bacterium]|nr:PDDEXK nuclease domain-containing protein [Bacteroidota bacterium]